MKMGSGSLAESGGSSSSSPPISSSESLNGLKFGRKIYFEDVGTGAPDKPGGGSGSSSSVSTPPKKTRGGGVVQGGQPPRCQVEGCKLDLSDAKAYYSRHKVCGMHSKSPKVIVAGLEQRFCQQCSRSASPALRSSYFSFSFNYSFLSRSIFGGFFFLLLLVLGFGLIVCFWVLCYGFYICRLSFVIELCFFLR